MDILLEFLVNGTWDQIIRIDLRIEVLMNPFGSHPHILVQSQTFGGMIILMIHIGTTVRNKNMKDIVQIYFLTNLRDLLKNQ